MDFLGLGQALERLNHLCLLEALVSQVVDDHLAVVRPVVLLRLWSVPFQMPPNDAPCGIVCCVAAPQHASEHRVNRNVKDCQQQQSEPM